MCASCGARRRSSRTTLDDRTQLSSPDIMPSLNVLYAVAHDLRHDRGRCDCSTPPISTDHTALRDKQARYSERVNESKVWQGMECDHGLTHRRQRRVVDIEPVDVCRFPHSH